ncbi:VWA domain-containing protein [Paludibaculum fermentans]|uniref:VWA domain-containing protein n=1 Tax=Paludibaculum fermentans TaxID=1473598 RepID=A0A7S7NPZ0_PALFE|nr:VWA domain-containing protein [Paludibaculum fermentans]QOY87149.1 VWA domain-containing protein [Paludibaculum fermentans]
MKRILISLLTCTALLAQKQDETPVFRTSSNLVIVTVFVRDKDGKPLKNMKREDFVVTENGKPQTISVFDFQELSGPPREAQTVVEARPETPAAKAAAPAAAPTGSQRYRDRRLLVLFFDWSSLPEADQVRAKAAAEKFLREQMTPADLVEIVSFGSKLKVEQEFTDDKDDLMRVIKRFQTGSMSELAAVGATNVDNSDDTAAYTADDTEFNIFNTDRKLAALDDLARTLGALPEKKAIVYFSSGISRTGDDNQAQLRATVNSAVRANVSFYPIDVRGLTADPPGGSASSGGGARGTGLYTGQTQSSQRQSMYDSQDTLTMLASDTGGKALLDNNELVMGIQQAQEDLQSYYILGYYSSDERRDGQFRRVDVKIAQTSAMRQQAKLDYRKGYFAEKEFKSFGTYDKEKQLSDALLLGDPVTELRLALEVNWFRIGKERYFVPVAVKIPGSAIPLKKQGSAETTTFDFIGQITNAKGSIMGNVRDAIKIQLRDQNAGQLANRSLMYDTGFTLLPGDYTIKMLVRENQTGKMGTFETKFQIPDLSSVKTGMKMSSVVWSGQRIPVTEAVGLADKKLKKQDTHPLVDNNQKLLPSVTHVFRKGQSMYVYAEMYDPAAPEPANKPAVTAAVTIYQEKKLVMQSQPVQVTALRANRMNTAGVLLEIPLTSLAPGEYTAQLNLVDQAGQKFSFSRASLVVLAR